MQLSGIVDERENGQQRKDKHDHEENFIAYSNEEALLKPPDLSENVAKMIIDATISKMITMPRPI
jgi:hypothetical protein